MTTVTAEAARLSDTTVVITATSSSTADSRRLSPESDLPSRLPVPGLNAAHEFAYVAYSDPLGAPLLADLEREYDARYGIEVMGEPAITEINRYPAELFASPHGAFLLLLRDGEPISGGAFMPHESGAAEVKRVWTRGDLRGRGLARIVLAELERRAVALGYTRFYLTTGPRQPEARALYLRDAYTPLFDVSLNAMEIEERGEPLAFVKQLIKTPAEDQHSSESDPS